MSQILYDRDLKSVPNYLTTDTFAAFEERLERGSPNVRHMDLNGDLGEAFPSNTIFVTLVVTPFGSAVLFSVKKSVGIRHRELWLDSLNNHSLETILFGDAQNIEYGWLGLIEQLRASWINKNKEYIEGIILKTNESAFKILYRLWNDFVGTIDAELRKIGADSKTKLVFILPGRMGVLPIHAACRLVAEGKWRYFLEDWSTSYAPSFKSYIAAISRKGRSTETLNKLIAITDPNNDFDIKRNPAWRAFMGKKRTELAGSKANKDAVLEAIEKGDYLSFFCHGKWHPSNPNQSALVLSDGLLTVPEIRMTNLTSCQLVVLAACESGLTDVVKQPRQQLGLTSAFIEAGASGVLSTNLMVEVTSTRSIVERFFELLKKGTPPDASLRQVQIEAIQGSLIGAKTKPSTQHGVDDDRVMDPIFLGGFGFEQSKGNGNVSSETASPTLMWASFMFFGC